MFINLLERKKVRIEGYAAHLLEPARCMVIYTDKGVLVARNHPEFPKWYCTQSGRFFHLTPKSLREIKPQFSPAMARGFTAEYPTSGGYGGSCYPDVLWYPNKKCCHHFMWEAWVGPRTKGMEIDHVNGNKFDWRLDNLEEVTPEENRLRARALRKLRSAGIDPTDRDNETLHKVFDMERHAAERE
mgnify:CR=1 FL=1